MHYDFAPDFLNSVTLFIAVVLLILQLGVTLAGSLLRWAVWNGVQSNCDGVLIPVGLSGLVSVSSGHVGLFGPKALVAFMRQMVLAMMFQRCLASSCPHMRGP